MDDHYYMERALRLAARGRGTASPNPMVGAVVVRHGKIIGEGYHQHSGGPHAEINAIHAAGTAALGATLYVTLEPCNHSGKTPPCTDAVIKAGIRRVVSAMADPNPDVAGGGHEKLEKHGIIVQTGLCGAKARRLNEVFIKWIVTKRPFVIAKCASTLDGRIATRTGDSRWVTGTASRRYVHELRHAADAVMVGIGTVITDDPALTTRLDGKNGKDPVRIILDTHCSIPPDARVLREASASDTIIVSGKSASDDKLQKIGTTGARVLKIPEKGGHIDLDILMDNLGEMGISSLLLEGGAKVMASAFSAKIVDKVMFFLAPKLLGGDDGIPVCRGRGPDRMKDALLLHDISVRQFDDDVLIEGYI